MMTCGVKVVALFWFYFLCLSDITAIISIIINIIIIIVSNNDIIIVIKY